MDTHARTHTHAHTHTGEQELFSYNWSSLTLWNLKSQLEVEKRNFKNQLDFQDLK